MYDLLHHVYTFKLYFGKINHIVQRVKPCYLNFLLSKNIIQGFPFKL